MQYRNLEGQKFNRLTAIKKVGINKHGKALWKCICDCGNEIIIDSRSLLSGNTKSCGCLKLEKITQLHMKHSLSHTKFYYVWQAMIRRCYDTKQSSYKDYGARGIKVCDRWRNSFENFYNDMFESYKAGLTLERINTNKGYCKENCRWATYKEQMRNTRRTKYIKINGIESCITDACKLINVNISTVYSTAIRNKISLQEAYNKHLNKKINTLKTA